MSLSSGINREKREAGHSLPSKPEDTPFALPSLTRDVSGSILDPEKIFLRLLLEYGIKISHDRFLPRLSVLII
jgi:hypothetical protein